MSVANLAALLDALDADGSFVTEGEAIVTVSNLSVAGAGEVAGLSNALGWAVRIEDPAATRWDTEHLDEAYEPFTLIIDKPAAPNGVLRLLTNTGLVAWLDREDERQKWQVGRLIKSFQTYGISFAPWDVDIPDPGPAAMPRGARRYVREAAGQRLVPANLNRWLLSDRDNFPIADTAAEVWAAVAARRLMLALPDEVEGEQQVLRFKGPPRLDLKIPALRVNVFAGLGQLGFLALQDAVDWIFEIEREAEMRHILLATELARCGGSGDDAVVFLRKNVADAQAGARTAYQVQLAGISSDALKTLSELRKSVSDDTAKVADGTRQIITAVASSLAIGVGLLAVRLSGTVNPLLVTVVLALAATYVGVTILSGVMFTLLQRRVRKAWQPRLYRFLSKPDYEALVGGPARTAERALWLSSTLGALAIILMLVALVNSEPPPPTLGKGASPVVREQRSH